MTENKKPSFPEEINNIAKEWIAAAAVDLFEDRIDFFKINEKIRYWSPPALDWCVNTCDHDDCDCDDDDEIKIWDDYCEDRFSKATACEQYIDWIEADFENQENANEYDAEKYDRYKEELRLIFEMFFSEV